MPDTKHVNKVVFAGKVLIDLTKDTVTSDDLLEGRTAHDKSGAIIKGAIRQVGSVSGRINRVNQLFQIDKGYHDGTGNVGIDEEEKAKFLSENIRNGVSLLGVEGNYQGIADGDIHEYQLTNGETQYTIKLQRKEAGTEIWEDSSQVEVPKIKFSFDDEVICISY